MKNTTWRLWTLAACTLIVGCASVDHSGSGATDILLDYEWVGNIDQIKFREPSGIVFHRSRGTLFVVGDEGDICEIRPDGTVVNRKINRGERIDYEGITVDPSTGLLYVAIEGADTVVQIDPDTLETKRRFVLERTFEGELIMDPGGQGIEAITFVADPAHPEGGVFYICNQSFTLDKPDEVSAILKVELPLRTTVAAESTGRVTAVMELGIVDLSGIDYDADADRLIVVSDATNSMWIVTREGRIESGFALIGQSQEGVAIDPEGHLYLAQDEGGIIKVRWLRP